MALGSRFSLWQLVGVLLLLAAIIAVQYQKGKRHIDTGVLFIVASAALFAAFQVTSARLAPVLTPGTYLVMTYLASTLLIGSVYAKTIKKDLAKLKDRLPVAYKTVGFAAGTMVMFYLFGYFAFQAAPDRGIVVILLTSQVILSVLLGIIFLKERSNMPRKIAAGIIAFIAAVLIKA